MNNLNINELNQEITTLFDGVEKEWEHNPRIHYVWGNVLSLDGVPFYYINDNKDIIGQIDYRDVTIKGFVGKLWYLNDVIVGFTRDSDNKYVTCKGLGLGNDMDSGYYIKGISESLKILEEQRQHKIEQEQQVHVNFLQYI